MIDKMLKRTSCSDYKKSDLSNEVIQSLKDVVNSSPTSTNSHHFESVFVTNTKIKKKIIIIDELEKILKVLFLN